MPAGCGYYTDDCSSKSVANGIAVEDKSVETMRH